MYIDYLNRDTYNKAEETRQESYKIDLWRKEYVSTRWGNAVPSWEERKAETEEMLKQWLQKHFYWN